MASLVFIQETDPWSGKVSSPSARRTIRSQVMKTYMISKGGFGNLNTKRVVGQSSKLEGRCPFNYVDPSGLSNACAASKEATGNSLSPARRSHSAEEQQSRRAKSPPRQLYRATDAFIYAGCSIDAKSYGLFSHYASEFRVILCEGIQPLPFAEQTLCCSAAIQENCTALVFAICFTAATHDLAIQCQDRNPLDSISSTKALDGPYQDALRYKSLSLHLLTKLLTQANVLITEAMILCVSVLLASATVYGDHVAITAHCNGLKHMFQLLGGEESLSRPISNHVQLANLKSCFLQRTPPLLSLRPYQQKHFEDLSNKTIHSEDPVFPVSMDSGFVDDFVSSNLNPAISRSLRYMAQLILKIGQPRSTQIIPDTLNLEDFIILEHKLISMPYETSLGPWDECIRVFLLLYSNTAVWKAPLWFPWVISLVSDLKAALLALDWQDVAKEPSALLLWIVLLGRYASSAMPEDEILWFSIRLRSMALALRIKEWSEALRILKRVACDVDLYGQAWRSTWDVVVAQENEVSWAGRLGTRHPCNVHL